MPDDPSPSPAETAKPVDDPAAVGQGDTPTFDLSEFGNQRGFIRTVRRPMAHFKQFGNIILNLDLVVAIRKNMPGTIVYMAGPPNVEGVSELIFIKNAAEVWDFFAAYASEYKDSGLTFDISEFDGQRGIGKPENPKDK